MSYSLAVLIVLIAVALSVSTRLNSRGSAGRPGAEYRRVFSTATVGLLLTVAGVTGWDLRYSHGWFQGPKRVDGPVWWQIGLGLASVALAIVYARRVRPRPAAK